jgi:hypothetical protein
MKSINKYDSPTWKSDKKKKVFIHVISHQANCSRAMLDHVIL